MEHPLIRPRVAVIGAGISGLCCGQALVGRQVDVVVFDKARGPGGRMSTRRDPERGSFDHGAQFFTVRDPSFRQQVDRWEAAGVVAPWTGRSGALQARVFKPEPPEPVRYVGTPRMSALTRHLSRSLYLKTATRIAALRRSPGGWILQSTDGVEYGPFAAAISAIPAPQAVPLLSPHAADLAARAAAARMRPAFCIMAAFDHPLSVPFDAARVHSSLLSWVARDSSKPGRDAGERWVLHAAPDWSAAHQHRDPDFVRFEMLSTFSAMTDSPEPEHAALHRWRYALAEGPFDPETPCLWDADQGLGACGDWLIGGRVEAAWLSGMAMARQVLRWLRERARG